MTLLSTGFYATASDLEPVLAAVQSAADIDFVACGLFDAMPLAQVHPHLRSHLDRFLTCDNGRPIFTRRVPIGPMRRTRYAVEQSQNPGSIEFTPGGCNTDGDLIAGRIAHDRDDKTAERLSRVFGRAIDHFFTLVDGVRVGPEAARLLERGVRLRPAADSLPATDLQPQPRPVLLTARTRAAAIGLSPAGLLQTG